MIAIRKKALFFCVYKKLRAYMKNGGVTDESKNYISLHGM